MKDNKDIEKLQDAIGGIKDEFIEEASSDNASQSPWNYNLPGNSWTSMALNSERRAKLKEESSNRSQAARYAPAIVACAVIALFLVLPKTGLFDMKTNEAEKPESETIETEAPTEDVSEAAPGEGASEGTASDSAESAGAASSTAEGAESEAKEEASTDDAAGAEAPEPDQIQVDPAAPFMLTAAEWKDNDNWPFFTNLVNAGAVRFPSYGLDPRFRVKARVTDEAGIPLQGKQVTLYDEYDKPLWVAQTNKDGICYLFYREGASPAIVASGNAEAELPRGQIEPVIDAEQEQETEPGQEQEPAEQEPGQETYSYPALEVDLVVAEKSLEPEGTQVMFIVDTTGSMSDELAYLQKDFAAIVEETFDSNMWFSVNFYRDEGDEYVTRTNRFTQNTAAIQTLLNQEYANGGGDAPEAVGVILGETITNNQEWKDNYNKIAFLIFDAPPHDDAEQAVITAVNAAASKGIHIIPVVASNAHRETELFGRALAICTDGTYVFLTDDSGIGNSHLEPIVGDYSVELLHDIIVRIINEYR